MDQRVPIVRFVERYFAADGWHANTIAVMSDTSYHSPKQTPVLASDRRGPLDRSKTKRVEKKNWARAHRKNVADNSTHPVRASLKWFNRARMVVPLHFDANAPSVACS